MCKVIRNTQWRDESTSNHERSKYEKRDLISSFDCMNSFDCIEISLQGQ